MKALTVALCVLLGTAQASLAAAQPPSASLGVEHQEETLLRLSKQKWIWMAERNMRELDQLFHDRAIFVHMGGTMSKPQELDVIRSGRIEYKKADILHASAQLFGDAAIVSNRIRLLAVVGGNEVTNPFVVTEVYVRQSGSWKLASLAFTRLLGS